MARLLNVLMVKNGFNGYSFNGVGFLIDVYLGIHYRHDKLPRVLVIDNFEFHW